MSHSRVKKPVSALVSAKLLWLVLVGVWTLQKGWIKKQWFKSQLQLDVWESKKSFKSKKSFNMFQACIPLYAVLIFHCFPLQSQLRGVGHAAHHLSRGLVVLSPETKVQSPNQHTKPTSRRGRSNTEQISTVINSPLKEDALGYGGGYSTLCAFPTANKLTSKQTYCISIKHPQNLPGCSSR